QGTVHGAPRAKRAVRDAIRASCRSEFVTLLTDKPSGYPAGARTASIFPRGRFMSESPEQLQHSSTIFQKSITNLPEIDHNLPKSSKDARQVTWQPLAIFGKSEKSFRKLAKSD